MTRETTQNLTLMPDVLSKEACAI